LHSRSESQYGNLLDAGGDSDAFYAKIKTIASAGRK